MKDLRKDFNYNESQKMSNDHEKKFKQRLRAEFEHKTLMNKSIIYKMAAVAVIAVLSTVLVLHQFNFSETASSIQKTESKTQIRLGDVSPELQTIEDYYTTSIKLELATIDTSPEYEDLVSSYIEELAVINRAYNELENDLNEFGVTEEVINAMIDNLQLRLELLQDLKRKLNNLNQEKNENNTSYQI